MRVCLSGCLHRDHISARGKLIQYTDTYVIGGHTGIQEVIQSQTKKKSRVLDKDFLKHLGSLKLPNLLSTSVSAIGKLCRSRSASLRLVGLCDQSLHCSLDSPLQTQTVSITEKLSRLRIIIIIKGKSSSPWTWIVNNSQNIIIFMQLYSFIGPFKII